MLVRAFVAGSSSTTTPLAPALIAAMSRVRPTVPGRLAWTSASNLHLTLAFLGGSAPERLFRRARGEARRGRPTSRALRARARSFRRLSLAVQAFDPVDRLEALAGTRAPAARRRRRLPGAWLGAGVAALRRAPHLRAGEKCRATRRAGRSLESRSSARRALADIHRVADAQRHPASRRALFANPFV